MLEKQTRGLILLITILIWGTTDAQLSGSYTVPGSYADLSSALIDLNTQGVSGAVTINIQAGHTETVSPGGFSLTVSGTSVNTITFQKIGVGANPLISAYSGGTGTPGTSVQDGIWRFVGCDYILIDGIDLLDPNTTNPSTMEYGFGFFKASTSNGCQNNTITNCVITLNLINNATGAGPSVDGSRGINVVNALPTFQTSNLTPLSAAGSNSYNRFYANNITNCNVGISLIGYAAPSPFLLADTGNDVGGLLSANGNTITNFGGASAATNAAAGIRTLAQYDLNISNNYIDNNTGTGANHVAALRGIFINTAVSANSAIYNNTISVKGSGTTTPVNAIENVSGATALNNTVTIRNNSIINCSNSTNTTGSFIGIYNNAASCTYLNITDNLFSNVATKSSTGSNYLIYNTGAVVSAITVTNNLFSNCTNTAGTSGSYFSIYDNSATSADLFLSGNTFTSCSANAATGAIHLIYNTGATSGNIWMNSNLVANCSYSFSSSGAFYAFYNNASSSSILSINSNTITNQTSSAGSGATHLLYNRGTLVNTHSLVTMQNNLISAFTFTSSSGGPFYSIWNNGVTTTITSITGNTLTNINWQATGSLRYGISNWAVGVNSISITNNLISNCTASLNTTGTFFGIYNNSTSTVSSGMLLLNTNTITAYLAGASSGDINYVTSSGATTNTFSSIELNDNLISACVNTYSGNGVYYGIYNNSASTLSLSILGNRLSGNNLVTTTGASYLLYNRGVANTIFSDVSINNNLVTAFTHSSTSSGPFYAIFNNGAATTSGTFLTIANNTLTSNNSNTSISPVNLIVNSAPVTTSISISGNLINQWTNTLTTGGVFSGIQNTGPGSGGILSISSNTLSDLFSSASTGIRYLIYNTATGTNSVSIQNNLISNTSHSASSSAAYYSIFNNNLSSFASLAIVGNTLSNNTSSLQNGANYLIHNSGTATQTLTNVSISNNQISGYTATTTTGTFFGVYNTGVNCNSSSLTGNVFTNVQLNGSTNTKYLIWNNSPVLSDLSLSNNALTNITTTLNTTGSVFGIYNSGSVFGNLTLVSNTISSNQNVATSGNWYSIYNSGQVTNSLIIQGNLITGSTFSANTSGSLFQIYNSGNVSGMMSVAANSVSLEQLAVTSGTAFSIYNTGNIVNSLDMAANVVSGSSFSTSAGGTYFGIRNTALGVSTLSVNANLFSGIQISVNTASTCLISNTGTVTGNLAISGNTFSNSIITNSTGAIFVACNEGTAVVGIDMNANTIVNFSLVSIGSGSATCISNSGPSTDITMSSNTLSAFNLSGPATNPYLISNTGNAGSSIILNNNLLSGGLISTPGATNLWGIDNSGVSLGHLKLSGNTFSNNSTTAASANIYLLRNSSFVSDSIVVKNNALSMACTNSTVSYSGNLYPLFNSGGSSTGSISIENNDFSNFLFTGPNGTGDVFFIYNTNNISSFRVNNNRWIGLVMKHNGAEYLIYNPATVQNLLSVSGNSIVGGYVRTGTAGSMYLYTTGTNSVSNATHMINANNFSGITATLQGNGTFCGICSYDGSSLKTISNNVISNINYNALGFMSGYVVDHLGNSSSTVPSTVYNNTFSAINWSGPLFGIKVNAIVSPLVAAGIFSNAVTSVSASGGQPGTYALFSDGLGAGINCYGNKIADVLDLSLTGLAAGIYVNNATTSKIYNNTVGTISAPFSNSPNAVTGIYVTGGATVEAYYNTVFLNATSTATIFGSSAIYASSQVNLNLRNNIFINIGTSSGSGKTVAFRRNSGPLTSYSLSSNNNVFYAGVPSANRLIFYNGNTSFSTMPTFQGYVSPRENVSVSENTPFLSTLGSSLNYLHVNPLLPSSTENGAINVSGIVTDYDAQVRQGNPGYLGLGSAPDIGADEYDQNLPPCSAANAGTAVAASPTILCAGETAFLYANGYSTTGGLVHQWKVSAGSTGPFVNVVGGTGFNTVSYASGSLSAGTYYYVLVTTCTLGSLSSTSNPVQIIVNAVPGASISVPSQTTCASVNFALGGSTDIGTGFLWMGPNNFTSANQNTVISNISTIASGTYSLIVSTSSCSSVGTVNVLVNPMPPSFLLSSSINSICLGASQTISASVPLFSPTVTLGTQVYQNSNSGYPAPYSAYYGGQKMQLLVLASELTSAGFIGGTPISSIQFPVVSLGTNWGGSIQDCQNFKIAMGSSTLSSLSTFQSGLGTVFSASSFTPVPGYGNIHSFSNPFVWDGASNLVIETLFSNEIYGTSGDAVIQYNSPTGFQSTLVYRADNQNVSSIAAATGSNINIGFVRPDLKLNGLQVGNYFWGPSAGLSSTTGSIVVASPSISTAYTASLSNGSCITTRSLSMIVMQIPTITISGSSSSVCVGNAATLIASGAASYTWSTNSTSPNITVFPVTTSTYVVLGANPACPVSSASIVITSAPAFTFNATANPTAVCLGQTGTLVASGAQQYLWSNGSNNASIAITPTTTSILSVTASVGTGCWNSKSLTLKVNNLPAIIVSPTMDTLCIGETVNLGASGASGYTWMPGNVSTASLVASPLASTYYTVIGSNLNDCTNTATVYVNVNQCTDLRLQVNADDQLRVFPNPSNGLINLDFNLKGTKRIRIYNIYGMLIDDFTTEEANEMLDLGMVSKGIYTVELSSGQLVVVKKIVIQ